MRIVHLCSKLTGMSIPAEISEIVARAEKAGVRLADVLRAAEVDRSTWSRWRAGITTPRLDNWRAVNVAVDDLIRLAKETGRLEPAHAHAGASRATRARAVL